MLKAFQEFIQCFQLWYNALYPDPPKESLEAAIKQWKITATSENASPKRSLEQNKKTRKTFKKKKLYGPFLWMGFNCLKARATSRRQFMIYTGMIL